MLAVSFPDKLYLFVIRHSGVIILSLPHKRLRYAGADDYRRRFEFFRWLDIAGVAQIPVVLHRRPLPQAFFPELRIHFQIGVAYVPETGCQQFVQPADLFDYGAADLSALFRGHPEHIVRIHPALDHGLMEQAGRRRDLHERGALHAAAGVAEDRYVVRIPAEAGYVLLHPAQRGHYVFHAKVSRVVILLAIVRQVEESEDIQPVVERYDHDAAVFTKVFRFIGIEFYGRATEEAASVQPDHNGLFLASINALGPNIDILAVLILRHPSVLDQYSHRLIGGAPALDRGRHLAIGQAVFYAVPWLHLLRRAVPFGVGILYSPELIYAFFKIPPHLALVCFNDRAMKITIEVGRHHITPFLYDLAGT